MNKISSRSNISKELFNVLINQLQITDVIAFYSKGKYFHIYGRDDCDWGYDIYSAMDEIDPIYTGVVEVGTAEEVLSIALKKGE